MFCCFLIVAILVPLLNLLCTMLVNYYHRFYLLNGARRLGVPAVLHECDFMTNRAAAAFMKSEAGRDIIARALCAGIMEIENNGGAHPWIG